MREEKSMTVQQVSHKHIVDLGKGLVSNPGEKSRSEVEDLSPQIHARVFEFGPDL